MFTMSWSSVVGRRQWHLLRYHIVPTYDDTNEFGTDFNVLPVRRFFDTDFNGLSVRRNLPQLARSLLTYNFPG